VQRVGRKFLSTCVEQSGHSARAFTDEYHGCSRQLTWILLCLTTESIPKAQVKNMSVGTLEELLVDELKDLYSAEKQIVRALPKIIKAVSTPELQHGLSNHLVSVHFYTSNRCSFDYYLA
jgi:hypothetical protein